MKITIIGAGSWGTALAILLGEKDYNVHLWTRREELAEEINKTKENRQYLKCIKIHKTVIASHSMEDVSNSDMVIFAVPSEFLIVTAKSFSKYIDKDTIVVHVVTLIEEPTGKLL